MKRWLFLCAALVVALLIIPSVARAQTATPTPTNTPTATNTATATATMTTTPAIVATGVTSGNQGYEVARYISAGDAMLAASWLIAIGLFGFAIFQELRTR